MEEEKFNKISQTQKLLKIEVEKERSFLRKITIISILSNIFIIIGLVFVISQQNYFVIQPNGAVNKLKKHTFDLNYDTLYQFADTTIINTFNYNYQNIDNLFDRNALYYTASGLDNLHQAFKNSNLIQYTKKYKVTKSTVPTNQIYKIVPAKFGINIFRSYSTEEITNHERKLYPSIIYELNIIKQPTADGQLYKLKVNSIKQYTYKEYKLKMGYSTE